MARGFESKSVESQQLDGRHKDRGRVKETLSDVDRRQERESIEMSRRRIVRELEAASSPVRKASLQHALRFLDDELKKLG